jgi:hypothetical protein
MKMNVIIIPGKKGRKGYPRIEIRSYEEAGRYIVHGMSRDFGVQHAGRNERKAIAYVLERMVMNIAQRRQNQKE